MLQPRQNGADLDKLPEGQRRFCMEMAADPQFSPTEAARKAGYAHPSQAAGKLMKQPRVKAYLGKVLRERRERLTFTADEVVRYMHDVLSVNPLSYFQVTDHGWWLSEEDLASIPEWVGRLIVKMRRIHIPRKGADPIRGYAVELVSKDSTLPLVAKHLGLMPADRHEHNTTNVLQVNWGDLPVMPEQPTVLEAEAKRVGEPEDDRETEEGRRAAGSGEDRA